MDSTNTFGKIVLAAAAGLVLFGAYGAWSCSRAVSQGQEEHAAKAAPEDSQREDFSAYIYERGSDRKLLGHHSIADYEAFGRAARDRDEFRIREAAHRGVAISAGRQVHVVKMTGVFEPALIELDGLQLWVNGELLHPSPPLVGH